MKITVPNRPKRLQRKLTAEDVILPVLERGHDLHPAYLMPGAVTYALREAGFVILSTDDLDNEIALAYQAGVDSVTEV